MMLYRNKHFYSHICAIMIMVLGANILAPITISKLGSSTDKILICTINGYEYISFDDYKNNTKQDKLKEHCVLCIFNNFSADKPASKYTYNYHIIAKTNLSYYQNIYWHKKDNTLYILGPRAPPSFIS